jgi:rod shape-determining protein MreC
VDEFFGRYRNLSVLVAVVFAQIILLGYQVRTDRGSRLLREWTVGTITPVTKGVRGLTQWAGSAWDNYFWLIDTKQDNDQLRRQLAHLKLENAGLRSSLARFGREQKLVAYQEDLASKTLLAQVIGKGANSNSREIFISRGRDSGVTAGMPVITPDGIVGRVQASYPGAALVMLISDPEAGVGVLLERSRAAGVLKGTGHAQCRIDYVSHEVDIAVGESVYTSGDDRVFPKGLRIGEVVKLDRGTDFQEIYLRPFAQLDRLEEVLVITSGVHQELPESPQAQPPQFLMPLPAEDADTLRAGAPAAETSLADGSTRPAQLASPDQIEPNGRVTDADRLRQYYQSIAAQQGHRIGYGGPGTVPEFNPERPEFNPERPEFNPERPEFNPERAPARQSASGASNTASSASSSNFANGPASEEQGTAGGQDAGSANASPTATEDSASQPGRAITSSPVADPGAGSGSTASITATSPAATSPATTSPAATGTTEPGNAARGAARPQAGRKPAAPAGGSIPDPAPSPPEAKPAEQP